MPQNCRSSEMWMHKFPLDVIAHILAKLNPVDRLESALVCQSWARAVDHPSMLRDVWLRVIGAQMQTIIPIVMKSRRPYRNLRVFQGNSANFKPEFWTKIGAHLRKLELLGCGYTLRDFFFILSSCPRLETLVLKGRPIGSWKLQLEQFGLQDSSAAQRVRESLKHVRDLHLEFHDAGAVIDHLIDLMPGTSRLTIGHQCADLLSARNLLPCLSRAEQVFTELDLAGVFLADRDLQDLLQKNRSGLEILRLDAGHLTRGVYGAIATCSKLRDLDLSGSAIDDAALERIVRDCPDLKILDLSLCASLSDACLAPIHALQGLEELSLAHCTQFTSAALSALGKFPALQSLNLLNGVDLRNLQSVACFEGLRSLHLGPHLDFDSFAKIVDVTAGLEELALSCEELTDRECLALRRLKELRNVAFVGAVGLTDRVFEEGLASPSLERLLIRNCPITDAGLASIAARHGHLRDLSLFECKKITDAGLAALLRREPLLEELVLCSQDLLRGGCLGELESSCPRLRRLTIWYCPIRSAAVEVLRRQRPSVDVLPVNYREWNVKKQRYKRVRTVV